MSPRQVLVACWIVPTCKLSQLLIIIWYPLTVVPFAPLSVNLHVMNKNIVSNIILKLKITTYYLNFLFQLLKNRIINTDVSIGILKYVKPCKSSQPKYKLFLLLNISKPAAPINHKLSSLRGSVSKHIRYPWPQLRPDKQYRDLTVHCNSRLHCRALPNIHTKTAVGGWLTAPHSHNL